MLSTCNRTEVYLAAGEGGRSRTARHGGPARPGRSPRGELAPSALPARRGVRGLHLFRVAAGLDSLVPGEGEILGQVRQAYEVGATGPLLDRLFRTALHAGRRARAETAIAESPSSVPAAAAALAQQVFDDLKGRQVLVVGAGKMSELTARNLVSRGAEIMAVANRSEDRAQALPADWALARSGWADGSPRSSTRPTLSCRPTSAGVSSCLADEVGGVVKARRGRPILFVDLAVPRDVDPALAAFDGCFVYDIDDLEAVVEASLAGRRAEAVRAERVVTGEAERFREWQASLAVVPAITSLRALAEEIRTHELERAQGRLGRLTETDRRLVESVTAQIVNKLLHEPTIRMKEAAVTADGVVYAEVVRHLFGLGGGAQVVTRQCPVGRPLPLQAPTAFVRIRPRWARLCGESRTASRRRCRVAARRVAVAGSR